MDNPYFVQLELIDNATIVRYAEVVEGKPRPKPGLASPAMGDYMKLAAMAVKRQAVESSDEALPDEARDRIVELAEKIESGVPADLEFEKHVSIRAKAVSCSSDAEIVKVLVDAREQLKKFRESGLEQRSCFGVGNYITAMPHPPSSSPY